KILARSPVSSRASSRRTPPCCSARRPFANDLIRLDLRGIRVYLRARPALSAQCPPLQAVRHPSLRQRPELRLCRCVLEHRERALQRCIARRRATERARVTERDGCNLLLEEPVNPRLRGFERRAV